MADVSTSIGLSALLSAQRGLEVVGHNMANISTPGYTRQTLELAAARPGSRASAGQVGMGVEALSVQRVSDLFLDGRIEGAQATNGTDVALASRLLELEGILGANAAGGLGGLLGELFASASALTARPDDLATRVAFTASARNVARGFRDTHAGLESAFQDISAEIQSKVREANHLAEQVADLNQEIVRLTAEGQAPNDLLDRRAWLARDLARLTGAQSAVGSGGALDISLGGRPLVSGTRVRLLTASPDAEGAVQIGVEGSSLVIEPAAGEVAGLRRAQETIRGFQEQLDTLARSLMSGLNQVQATGVPRDGPYTSLTTTVAATDVNGSGDPTDDPLAFAGLPFSPGVTEIVVTVTDQSTGAASEARFAFDPRRDTLADLAAALSGVTNVSALAGPDGLLRVNAAAGYGFDFAARGGGPSDTGGLLAALGVSPLFSGSGAADVELGAGVAADPRAIAAGLAPGRGDARNASRLLALGQRPLEGLGGTEVIEFFATIVASVGEAARSAERMSETSDSALSALDARRESISGVSVEEEVAAMIRFQRAFEAAARFLQVVNGLADDLLSIVR